MIWATKVNKDNLKLIADLNDGIAPAQECVDNPTYFVHPDSDDDHNQLLTPEVFFDNFEPLTTGLDAVLTMVQEI